MGSIEVHQDVAAAEPELSADCVVAFGGMDGVSVRDKGIAREHLSLPKRFVGMRHRIEYDYVDKENPVLTQSAVIRQLLTLSTKRSYIASTSLCSTQHGIGPHLWFVLSFTTWKLQADESLFSNVVNS